MIDRTFQPIKDAHEDVKTISPEESIGDYIIRRVNGAPTYIDGVNDNTNQSVSSLAEEPVQCTIPISRPSIENEFVFLIKKKT